MGTGLWRGLRYVTPFADGAIRKVLEDRWIQFDVGNTLGLVKRLHCIERFK